LAKKLESRRNLPRSAREVESMGIREKINETRVAPLFGAGALLAAIAITVIYFWPTGPHVHYTQAFYSDDDGQTYYEDSLYKFAPFDHNGKTAVLATVYEDAHNTKFVAYLLRYTPDALKKLQKTYADVSATGTSAQVQQTVIDLMETPAISIGGTEIKLPGASNQWVPHGRMMVPAFRMPDGGDAGTMVLP
jgi:hypothetical protein